MGHAEEQPHKEHTADIVHLHEVRKRKRHGDVIDPYELGDREVIEAFLSEVTHMIEERSDTQLTAKIVERLISDRYEGDVNVMQQEWRARTMGLMVSRLDLDAKEEQALRDNDPLLIEIDEVHRSMTKRATELRLERRALLGLYDLRLAVAQDIENMDSPKLQEKWRKALGHLAIASEQVE